MATGRLLTSLRLRSCAGNRFTPRLLKEPRMARQRTRALVPLASTVAALSLLAACGSDGGSTGSDPSSPPAATTATTAPTDAIVAGQPIPAARCEANKAAGKITYLSGFDFAASASIVDVLVAKQKGY